MKLFDAKKMTIFTYYKKKLEFEDTQTEAINALRKLSVKYSERKSQKSQNPVMAPSQNPSFKPR